MSRQHLTVREITNGNYYSLNDLELELLTPRTILWDIIKQHQIPTQSLFKKSTIITVENARKVAMIIGSSSFSLAGKYGGNHV